MCHRDCWCNFRSQGDDVFAMRPFTFAVLYIAALNVCIQSLLVLEVFEGGPGTPWPRTYPDKQSTLDSQPYTRLPAPNMCGPRCRSRILLERRSLCAARTHLGVGMAGMAVRLNLKWSRRGRSDSPVCILCAYGSGPGSRARAGSSRVRPGQAQPV